MVREIAWIIRGINREGKSIIFGEAERRHGAALGPKEYSM
jgi:hypothetical protein